MTDALTRWREALHAWRIPEHITAAIADSPWTMPAGVSERRADAASPGGESWRRANERLPGSVLDVGSGAGAASLALVPHVAELTAVDTSPGALAHLRDLTERLGLPARTVVGRWPDVAALVPPADVVVCHHVLYNVPDLDVFVEALTSHARRRVVVELTPFHPLRPLNPLWKRFHDLERPDAPLWTDALAVIADLGVRPRAGWSAKKPGQAYPSFSEMVAATRRRLCLPPERDADVADGLVELGVDTRDPRHLGDQFGVRTIWWDGHASSSAGESASSVMPPPPWGKARRPLAKELESPATGDFTMGLMHIGELAKRTRLSVKTVRYYSDLGLVPEADRTASGYRRYGGEAVLRLEFVRTLRELGLGLASIRQVLAREVELSAVADAHANAIDAQIRMLRIQRAALRTLARGHHTPEEVERMSRLAQATAEERHRLINEFIDSIFEGQTSGLEAGMRRAMPDLPDEPSDEQVDAWIELAALVRDEGFRERLRAMGRRTAELAETRPAQPDAADRPDAMATAAAVNSKAGPAAESGLDPASSAADVIHDELVAVFAESAGRTPDEAYRRELLETTRLGMEPRAERYWQLIAIINGWPPIPSTMAHWTWFTDALAARLPA